MENAGSLLNFAWVGVCLTAFAWFLVATSRRRANNRRFIIGRALALGVALVSLFPCVSSSDDSIALIALNGRIFQDAPDQWSTGDRHPSPKTTGILVGMLEDLEAAQVAAVVVVNITLCVFALFVLIRHGRLETLLPSCAGRAPPCWSLPSV